VTTPIQRPDPNTVGPEHVATAARNKVTDLADQLVLRDAKINELTAYIAVLESRLEDAAKKPAHAATPGAGSTPPTR